MTTLLVIAPAWSLVLVLVVGLCAAAHVGDRQQIMLDHHVDEAPGSRGSVSVRPPSPAPAIVTEPRAA